MSFGWISLYYSDSDPYNDKKFKKWSSLSLKAKNKYIVDDHGLNMMPKATTNKNVLLGNLRILKALTDFSSLGIYLA